MPTVQHLSEGWGMDKTQAGRLRAVAAQQGCMSGAAVVDHMLRSALQAYTARQQGECTGKFHCE